MTLLRAKQPSEVSVEMIPANCHNVLARAPAPVPVPAVPTVATVTAIDYFLAHRCL